MKTTMMKDKKAVKSIVKTRVLFQKWLEIDAKLYEGTGLSFRDILLRSTKQLAITKRNIH